MNLPDATPVTDLVHAFRCSKTMFVAVSLGIFDRIHEHPQSAADLAAATATNPDALERLLDGCAALGLLAKQDGVYRNTEAAEVYLWSGSPYSLCGYIQYSEDALYSLWGNLGDAVREGTHRWKQTFGLEGSLFSAFFHSDDAMRHFLRGMHGNGTRTSSRVVEAFDLSRFRKLVDLGGATGHLVIAACERYPELHGVVFDLEPVTAVAREYVTASPARGRIETVAGDFFAGELPPADLYAVGQILHDWTETKIDALLRRIFHSLPAGGALLVAEKLLNEDGVGPLGANMQSLSMLVCTEGKERTLTQYTALLRAAGFSEIEGRRTGAYLDAVLAVKS